MSWIQSAFSWRSTVRCCDPPCRLMQIQAMNRRDLIEALIESEHALEMAEAYIDDQLPPPPTEVP